MNSLICSSGGCLALNFSEELLYRTLGYLNVQELRRVCMASRFEGLQLFVAEETLRWVVNSHWGSDWELRVDSVKMIFDTVEEARQEPGEVDDSDQSDDSGASADSKHSFKPFQIKQCVVRRPLAGDTGPLGKCHWASEGASLWFKRRRARTQKGAAGKSLDIQIAALLKLWRPPDAANVCTGLSAGSASNATALRCLVEWLSPDLCKATREDLYLTERLSIEHGNMLELLAVSSVDVDHLVDPADVLVRCGATAGGQHVLEALRKVTQDKEMNGKWTSLWTRVAATQLRKALTEFQAPEAENIHDHELLANLEDATIAGLATHVDVCLLEDAMNILAEDLDAFRCALWRAVITECCRSTENVQAPNSTWLTAWLRAGAGEQKSAWLAFEMVREYYGELPEKTPLSHIGASIAAPHLLIDCVSSLVEYGDFGGLALWVISGALKKIPTEEPTLSQWRLAWCSAAKARLRWALLDHDFDEIEDALAVAQDVGLSGHDVELAERILES